MVRFSQSVLLTFLQKILRELRNLSFAWNLRHNWNFFKMSSGENFDAKLTAQSNSECRSVILINHSFKLHRRRQYPGVPPTVAILKSETNSGCISSRK